MYPCPVRQPDLFENRLQEKLRDLRKVGTKFRHALPDGCIEAWFLYHRLALNEQTLFLDKAKAIDKAEQYIRESGDFGWYLSRGAAIVINGHYHRVNLVPCKYQAPDYRDSIE